MTALPVDDCASTTESTNAAADVELAGSPRPTSCVVIPTRNESANVVPLVARLEKALTDLNAEIVFVDDSDDDTPDVIAAVARTTNVRVRLVHRAPGERAGGLGGAVLAGMRWSEAPWVVVMDGDLQHPPEVVPRLLEAGAANDLDVVVASRYREDGNAAGLSSRYRRIASSGASAAAKIAFPHRLAGVTDPMSGFFALRVDKLDPKTLRPNGFKILLEILGRSAQLRVGEVAFTFAERNGGVSKATYREAVRYFRQLLGLRLALSKAGWRLARFALVGLSGFFVNLGVLQLLLLSPLGWSEALRNSASATAAAQLAILWNFALTERWVFAGQQRAGRTSVRLIIFWALGSASLFIQLPLAIAVQKIAHLTYVTATAVALAALVALRFLVLDRLLYCRRPGLRLLTAAVPAAGAASAD